MDDIAVHCYGPMRRHSDAEALQNIERLVGVMENGSLEPWSVSELNPDDVQTMVRNVVSFEIPISRIEGKFKLNQGEKPERTRTAIERLEQQGSE
jgi:transcriptional regulator